MCQVKGELRRASLAGPPLDSKSLISSLLQSLACALIFALDAECLTAQRSAAHGGFQDNTVYVGGDIGSAPKGGTEAKACARITLLPQSLDVQITPRSPHVCMPGSGHEKTGHAEI